MISAFYLYRAPHARIPPEYTFTGINLTYAKKF